jgi:hypothetical protein
MSPRWPDGKRFAFTAVDDTDWTTIANTKPVYDLLADLGLRTTKSVWIFDGQDGVGYQGQTCQDRDYLAWVLELQKVGFEISLHNAAPVTSARDRTCAALERFRDYFGAERFMHCNHRACGDNLYWGDERLSGLRRRIYNCATASRRCGCFRGHVEGDPVFWGDLCRDRITYVRNFVFRDINTLKMCPEMPYHDTAKPFVNQWFASSDGGSLRRFLRTYSRENIDRLVEEGGLSIAYVHFGSNFVSEGRLNPEFRSRLEYIAGRGGWFVPASTMLDHLAGGRTVAESVISPATLRGLEFAWLRDRLGERFTL